MEPSSDGTKPVRKRRRKRATALLCLGLDGKDGHTRITKGEAFLLVGGSEATHEQMQEFTIRLTEALEKRGTRLSDASPKQIREIASDLD